MTLNLPDLLIFMNDPVSHDPTCPTVPTKLPSNIRKFERKDGEDPGEHVRTFHLWCSSNSLHNDSIHLRLFQCTLTGPAEKWYIELRGRNYTTFDYLSLTFLNHFQLPVCYEVGTKLLSTFQQDKAMHILDHIQEWRRWKRLIKAFIPLEFLLEWFLMSLLPYITKDVSTFGVQNEDQDIFRAQELDLIYAQSGLLYEIIPNAPRSNFDPKIKLGPHADGIVGSTSTKLADSVMKQVSQLSINQPASVQATTSSQPTQSASVLSVQTSNPKGNQQLERNKKKGKNNHKGRNKNENGNNNDKNMNNAGGTRSLNVR